MIETLTGLTLGRVRHNDRFEVVTLYTRQRGRVPFIVSSAATPKGRLTRARLMPLSIVETTFNFKSNVDLQRPGQFNVVRQFPTIYSDPRKSALTFFLTEFLSQLLRDYPADDAMWNFIVKSLTQFDQIPGSKCANFHIAMLARLTVPLGISPDVTGYLYHPGHDEYFDMRAGEYTHNPPAHRDYLNGEAIKLPVILDRLNYENCTRLRLNRNSRREILGGLLHYYSLHFPGLDSLSSLDILRSLFD
ncbi:MAG: DNA repair protein RecO C-terminal domain-containing protein [Prevotella sp.]|nr:DNA repair protein RecO C-terminal domain-containing protein [Bacteroides sp.]MCM1367088.1 DNA repair protein RecO C-terminal domain-containing protein [Prevotella sp.]MCM1437561.1 DNA repair protein RecO C-terminal domain-containing protein [Prevotella sp.]